LALLLLVCSTATAAAATGSWTTATSRTDRLLLLLRVDNCLQHTSGLMVTYSATQCVICCVVYVVTSDCFNNILTSFKTCF